MITVFFAGRDVQLYLESRGIINSIIVADSELHTGTVINKAQSEEQTHLRNQVHVHVFSYIHYQCLF